MKQEDLFDSLSDHFEAKAEFGETQELTEANFVIPEESDYVDFGEDTSLRGDFGQIFWECV